LARHLACGEGLEVMVLSCSLFSSPWSIRFGERAKSQFVPSLLVAIPALLASFVVLVLATRITQSNPNFRFTIVRVCLSLSPSLVGQRCRYNYQLLTFMTINEFGEGAVVQHSLLEANGDCHMDKAIYHFKHSHPTRTKLVQVIVVDKDINEIRVLETHFPEARVLVCHFHVIKYLREMGAKPEFGKVFSDDASQIDACVHKMVYADSAAAYDASHVSFGGLCDRIGIYGFFAYFEKNWHTSQERWVIYLRADLPHFHNHTNNRLESFFGKLKDGVDGSMSMAQCVKALIAYDRRVENEYRCRLSRIGQFVNSNYDEEMSNLLRFTTPDVASQVETEYAFAVDRLEVYSFVRDDEDEHLVRVQGGKKAHEFRDFVWRCSCDFSVYMRLPCRHVITFRKSGSVAGPVIPGAGIDERYVYFGLNPGRSMIFTCCPGLTSVHVSSRL
jgi:hypothetical protein